MATRRLVLLLACPLMGGCVSGDATPQGAFGFSVMPSWAEMAKKVEMGAMRMVPDAEPKAPVPKVARRESTTFEKISVSEVIQASMPQGTQSDIVASRSGTTGDGMLLTCGLASGVRTDGGRGWSGLFLVETDPKEADSVSRVIEIGSGLDQVSVHSHCRELGLG
jgi:hypothetical protein